MEDDTQQKKALKQLTVAEELDTMMVVVRSKGWLVLLCGLAILSAIIIWGFFGKIPIKVSGVAISLSTEGNYVIASQVEGTVVEILAHQGRTVEKGDTIVRIIDPISQLEIAVQKEKIAVLQLNLDLLRNKIEEESKEKTQSLKQKVESEEYALINQQNAIPFLEKDLESKKRLNQEGILPLVDAERARLELAKAKNEIEMHKANIAVLKSEFVAEYRENEIRAAEINLFEAQKQMDRLLLGKEFLDIKTDKSGTVLEIVVANGDRVKPGQMVASVEAPLGESESMQFYGAIGGEYGVLLKEGLPVQLEVAGVDAKQYGYLLGIVDYISPYPASTAELTAVVDNPQIVEFLKGGEQAVYSVVIKLFGEPSTVSGYKWTTTRGPPQKVTTGTLATIRIVVQEKRPIFYILPEEIGPYVQDILPGPTEPPKEILK